MDTPTSPISGLWAASCKREADRVWGRWWGPSGRPGVGKESELGVGVYAHNR